jgi:hypothetical protein
VTAPALYATPRDPSRRSDGSQIGVVARSLGTPLIPWQQQVADVASERRADGSYEYQVVVVSVPRQTGKTTLIRAMAVHSALVLGRTVFYTAQTGKDARERWTDLVKILQVHPALAGRFKLTLRGGSEQVEFHQTGGAVRAFAPTPESLHGYTPPKVVIDEAFAQTPAQGELLMGAIGPAQFTIVDRQLWIVSTAGTAESTFLHDWIDRGIEGTPRVAAFVWGANDEQDPFNLEHIAAFHPGVGHVLNGKLLSAEDVLEQADRNSRAEYERAYANRRTLTLSHLIPAETWRGLEVDDLEPPSSTTEAVLTFDVDNTRGSSAITATWEDQRGRPVSKVVKAGPGMGWLAGAVDSLRRDWRPRDLVAVGNGPVLDVVARVNQLAGEDVVKVLTEREYAAACTGFLSRIEEGSLGHDGGDVLAKSVVGLVTRPAGDGVAFSRRHSVGDSSAAIAAAAGTWVLTTTRKAAAPFVYFGSENTA